MKTHPALPLCFAITLLLSCSKAADLSDLSNIYLTDRYGNIQGGDQADKQWQSKSFTAGEMNLFADLDTATLTGTSMPASVESKYAYPNPFVDYTGIPIWCNADFTGQIIVKYVVVNRLMNAVQKGTQRLQTAPNTNFEVIPAFPAGNYRLYFTLSADGHEHFYKSWGNIERR